VVAGCSGWDFTAGEIGGHQVAQSVLFPSPACLTRRELEDGVRFMGPAAFLVKNRARKRDSGCMLN
jgi:hypothetical protein